MHHPALPSRMFHKLCALLRSPKAFLAKESWDMSKKTSDMPYIQDGGRSAQERENVAVLNSFLVRMVRHRLPPRNCGPQLSFGAYCDSSFLEEGSEPKRQAMTVSW